MDLPPVPAASESSNEGNRRAELAALRAIAAAHEVDHAWDRLTGTARLDTDAGAAFVMVASLASAFAFGRAADADPTPNRTAVARVFEVMHARCVERDLAQRLGNRFSSTSHLAGPIGDNWLLAALATPPLGEFAARVSALNYLVALAVLAEEAPLVAARRVADAARLSRSIITWSALLREMPDPAAVPRDWPARFAAWARDRLIADDADRQPPAIQAFHRALLQLLQLTRRDIDIPRVQRALLPDDPDEHERFGAIKVVSSPGPRAGHRASRRESRDDDGHRQLSLAYFEEADDSRPGGQEPTTLALHVRDDVLPGELAAAPAAQAQDARLVSYQVADMEQVLRWSWDHLNEHELRLVASTLREQLCVSAAQAPSALLVATVLATGIPVEDVVNVAISSTPGREGIDAAGRWTRLVPRPPKAWKPATDILARLQPRGETLTLELEPFLASAWSEVIAARPGARTVGQALGLNADTAPARLSEWLQPLREQAPWARLTRGRLWRALRVEVNAVLGNDAAVHFIVGTDRDVPPTSSYYTAAPQADLEAAYRAASARLFANGPIRPIAVPPSEEGASPILVGSCKVPDAAWLRSEVQRLADGVASAPAEDLSRAHNRYVAHTLWLLMFATGHRAVTHPIESLDVIDLDGGWLSVSDKSVRAPGEARIVPLCNLAIQAIAAYVDHLGRLAALVRQRDEALCRDVLSVISRRGPRALPLFFLLGEDLAPRFIAAGELTAMAPGLAPLQANLARHLLSSGEAALGPMADLVRDMLGHVQHGQPVFGPQSPMAGSHHAPLRSWLDDHLRALGWQVRASPLPAAPRNWASPSQAARSTRLGQAHRRRVAHQALQRSRGGLRKVLDARLGRRPLRAINQADVDAIFGTLLDGRKMPATIAEVEACRRAYRLLSWCQQRYGLDIRLPKVYLPAPPPPAAFDADTLPRAKAARDFAATFDRLVTARARGLRHALASPGRQAAETAVSLAVHSRIAHACRLNDFVEGAPFELLDDGHAGAWVVLSEVPPSGSGAGRPMNVRHAVHPVTAALLTRLHACRREGRDEQGRHREVIVVVEQLRHEFEPDAFPFASAASAIRWLCDRMSALNALELPGTVAGYLDGSTGGVSLPPAAWARLVRGRPLRPGLTCPVPLVDTQAPNTEPSDGEHEVDGVDDTSTSGAIVAPTAALLPALVPCRDDPAPGVALQRVRSLHKAVRKLLHQHVRGLGSGHTRANQSSSRNQKETLIPALEDLLRRFADVAVLAAACAQWLVHLLLHGSGGAELRARSCTRYYFSLAPRLPLALAMLDVAELDADTLAQAYGEFLDQLGPTAQPYAFRRLQVFHAFLMVQHGVPPIEWAEVAPTTLLPSLRVDANIVTWPEHAAVLGLLAGDVHADERTRVLQAIAWFFVFRFGARINEVLGLRRKDVVWQGDQLVVLLRPNAYRDLKTHAGVRQVPLIGPLSALERHLLESWLEHVDHYASVDHLAALFGERGHPRELVDTRAVTARITQALHAVTGDETLRIHSGRHAFACRLQLLVQLDAEDPVHRFRPLFANVLGPTDPAVARRLLTDTPDLSRRGLWAAKLAMGHASPATMQRCYCHLDDLLSALALEPVFARYSTRMNRRTLAYAAGVREDEMPKAVDVRESPVTLARVRRLRPDGWSRSESLVVDRAAPPRLPPRAVPIAPPLTPVLADQALGFVHRRGELDGAHHTLLIPARQLQRLFVAERAVREASGYDVEGARWPQTSTSTKLRHVRAGHRSAPETARVQPFLAALEDKLRDDAFAELTRKVCDLWIDRYRHDCTPLVLASREECEAVLEWLHQVGLSSCAIEVRVPVDEAAEELDELRKRFAPVAVVTAAVPAPRTRLRRSAALGMGVVLLENGTEPLTQMSQVHRVLHVLSAWAGALK